MRFFRSGFWPETSTHSCSSTMAGADIPPSGRPLRRRYRLRSSSGATSAVSRRCSISDAAFRHRRVTPARVTYDEFKALWLLALRESGLRTFGAEALSERLELRATDRIGESVVEPYHRPDPFTVSAKFRWRWDALHSARTATTEEDMLVELFGRGESASAGTRRPWLRVDISLHASLPLSQPMPLPSKATWALWVRDVIQTLASRAPIIPREGFREDAQGQLEILAYQGEPEAKVLCSPDGELT